ncbi:hypothetical protein VPH35_123470 [Triticum aestivum]
MPASPARAEPDLRRRNSLLYISSSPPLAYAARQSLPAAGGGGLPPVRPWCWVRGVHGGGRCSGCAAHQIDSYSWNLSSLPVLWCSARGEVTRVVQSAIWACVGCGSVGLRLWGLLTEERGRRGGGPGSLLQRRRTWWLRG